MANIAISYRREDSLDITGRIFDRLVTHYGRDAVFRDIDSMRAGIDFRQHIKATLDASDILIVVVGPKWLGRDQGGEARISNEADFVRFEVETALKKGVPVIPLLVGQADMPTAAQLPQSIKELAFRHAVSISSGKDFDHHMSLLIHDMDRLLQAAETAPAPTRPAPAKSGGGQRPAQALPEGRKHAAPVRSPAAAAAVEPSTTMSRQQSPVSATAVKTTSLKAIVRLAIAAVLAAKAALLGYWDYFFLTGSQKYVFAEDPLLIPELVILIPGLIAVAVGTILAQRWARIGGLAVCLYAIGNDIYYVYIAFGAVDLPMIGKILFYSATVVCLLFFLFGWPWAARPSK